MVKRWIMVCLGLLLGTMMYAQEFSKVASKEPELIQKGKISSIVPFAV